MAIMYYVMFFVVCDLHVSYLLMYGLYWVWITYSLFKSIHRWDVSYFLMFYLECWVKFSIQCPEVVVRCCSGYMAEEEPQVVSFAFSGVHEVHAPNLR